MFINNQQDYKEFKHFLENGEVYKIMPFKQLKSFAINAVLTHAGTFIGPLFTQIIGHEQLTLYKGGYCGNELRSSYFEDKEVDLKIRREIYRLT